jgi:hypothetical protein
MNPTDYVTCGGVNVSQSSFWQSERKRTVVAVNRDGFTVCELHYGSPEERPLVSVLVGAVLLLPGGWLVKTYSLNHAYVAVRNLRYDCAMILFFGLGLWLIYQAMGRRAYYLRIISNGVGRKLVFAVKTGAEVYSFLDEAKSRFDLNYVDRVPVAVREKPTCTPRRG